MRKTGKCGFFFSIGSSTLEISTKNSAAEKLKNHHTFPKFFKVDFWHVSRYRKPNLGKCHQFLDVFSLDSSFKYCLSIYIPKIFLEKLCGIIGDFPPELFVNIYYGIDPSIQQKKHIFVH